MQLEEIGGVNTELRCLTIELMKIAEKRGVPFRIVAEEFLKNTTALHELIKNYKGKG